MVAFVRDFTNMINNSETSDLDEIITYYRTQYDYFASLKAFGVTVSPHPSRDYLRLTTHNRMVAERFQFGLDLQACANGHLQFEVNNPRHRDRTPLRIDCDRDELDHLVGAKEVVQYGKTLGIIIDFPVRRPMTISLPPKAAWTRRALAVAILNGYRALYATASSRREYGVQSDDDDDRPWSLTAAERDDSGHWRPILVRCF